MCMYLKQNEIRCTKCWASTPLPPSAWRKVPYNVARSHRSFLAKSRKKFCPILKNSVFLYLCFTGMLGIGREILYNGTKFRCPNKMNFFKFLRKETATAPFRPLLAKVDAVQPPKFLGKQIIFAAHFELFWRIFGHLATVVPCIIVTLHPVIYVCICKGQPREAAPQPAQEKSIKNCWPGTQTAGQHIKLVKWFLNWSGFFADKLNN